VTEDEFWQLIGAAGVGRDRYDGGDAIAEALTDLLATRDPDAILDFQEHFDRLHGALYMRKYWAVGYVLGGGCSDDAFTDFRAGVISLGRDWHQRFRAEPDCLADHEEVRIQAARRDDEALFAEPVNYAAAGAYERVTGQSDEFYDRLDERRKLRGEPDAEPDMGENFDFEDRAEMHRRLPRLAALYGWSSD
jgi:hypothetical protein